MSTKLEQLKKLNAEKKALAEKSKALREELNATKDQRNEARKSQAQARKDVRTGKASIRDLCASIYNTFSKGTPEEIESLADGIMESASELAGTVRKFAEATKDPEVETEDEEL